MKIKEIISKNNLKRLFRQYKGLGISISLILIIISIVMYIFPLTFSYISIWLFVISIFLVGLFDLFAFFFGNDHNKKVPYLLFKSIFNLAVSILIFIPLIINSVRYGFTNALVISSNDLLYWVILLFGFILMINGFNKIIKANMVVLLGGIKWVEITIGILYIVSGILVMFLSLNDTVTYLIYILATYLLIYGIIILIELLTSPTLKDFSKVIEPKKSKKHSKNEDIEGEVIDIDDYKKGE